MAGRRLFLLGTGATTLAGCFDKPYYEQNPEQKNFLGDLQEIAKPALASNNPLQIEEAARKTLARADQVGAFSDWQGLLKVVESGREHEIALTEGGAAFVAASLIVRVSGAMFNGRSTLCNRGAALRVSYHGLRAATACPRRGGADWRRRPTVSASPGARLRGV